MSCHLRLSAAEKKTLVDLIDSFSKVQILVIGDFILDQFIWGRVDRISPEAPVPVVHVQNESYMPGGALNVGNNIRMLSGRVLPCGVIGRDREGRVLVKLIREEKVNTDGIIYSQDRPTSVKTRIIAHSQQVVRIDRERLGDVVPETRKKILQFVRKQVAHCDAVVIEDYGKGVIHPQLLKEVVQLSEKYRKPVIVDPKEKHFSYYQGATVITPNRTEALGAYENFFGEGSETDLERVGKGLLKRLRCQAVLMTLGEDGMALFEKNGTIFRIPTTAREVYDVSGAGDTVVAVLGLAIAAGASMKHAAVLANLAAGVVVGKLGTATVQKKELRKAVEMCPSNNIRKCVPEKLSRSRSR